MKTTHKSIVIALIAISASMTGNQTASTAVAANSTTESAKIEGRYEGSWVTTKNKKLNGTANCQVKQLSKDHWQGRFWGIWQQVPFDYTVEFGAVKDGKSGPVVSRETIEPKVRLIVNTGENPVAGTASIDGASYEWIGNLTANEFTIQFTGSRYDGYLELKRVPDKKP